MNVRSEKEDGAADTGIVDKHTNGDYLLTVANLCQKLEFEGRKYSDRYAVYTPGPTDL